MELERAEKKDVKALKSKNDDVSNVSNVGEHDDAENSLEELKSRFEQVKQMFPRKQTILYKKFGLKKYWVRPKCVDGALIQIVYLLPRVKA